MKEIGRTALEQALAFLLIHKKVKFSIKCMKGSLLIQSLKEKGN